MAMTLEEAQAKLTERNPGVDALTFEATRKPAFIKCSKCGYEAEVSRFELAYKWKCPTCAAKDTIRQRGREYRGKQHSTTRSDMLLLWSCEELYPIMALS